MSKMKLEMRRMLLGCKGEGGVGWRVRCLKGVRGLHPAGILGGWVPLGGMIESGRRHIHM